MPRGQVPRVGNHQRRRRQTGQWRRKRSDTGSSRRRSKNSGCPTVLLGMLTLIVIFGVSIGEIITRLYS